MKTESSEPKPSAAASSRNQKWLRRGGIALVTLTSLTALFYAVENWRGARAWMRTVENLQARAVPLSLEDFKHAPVPDERNMVMHPALRCFTFVRADGTRARRLERSVSGDSGIGNSPQPRNSPDAQDAEMAALWEALVKFKEASPSAFEALYDFWDKPSPTDSEARQAAERFLSEAAPHEPLLTALREALSRPDCSWPGAAGATPGGNPAENLSVISTIGVPLISAARLLHAHAWAQAAVGNLEAAWAEAAFFPALSSAAAGIDPSLATTLLTAAVFGEEESAIQHLLQFPAPPAQVLDAMEREFEKRPSALNRLATTFAYERAFVVSLTEWISAGSRTENSREAIGRLVDLRPAVARVIPEGWLKQNAVTQLRLDDDLCGILGSGKQPAEKMRELESFLTTARWPVWNPYSYTARNGSGIYRSVAHSLLRSDARRVLLRTLLLAARQRAADGKTPMTLDDLAPELRARVTHSPMHEDFPRISRDAEGVWTLSCKAWGENTDPAQDPSLKIRGW